MATSVLYGSVNGNAKAIAEKLYNLGISNGYYVTISELNNYEKEILSCKNIIIICSTTGYGEFPENAQKFYKFLKNNEPKTVKNVFGGKIIKILAIGDSNYNNFCNTGKIIKNKLKEYEIESELLCIDVNNDMESVVEPYIKNIWNTIDTHRTFRSWVSRFFDDTKNVFV